MNRRDFLKQAGTAAAALVAPKLPRLETKEQKQESEAEDDFLIGELTEIEKRAVYSFCLCGEYRISFRDGNFCCRGCGKPRSCDMSDRQKEALTHWFSSVDEPTKFTTSVYAEKGEAIYHAIVLSHWEKFRAYHMVRGTFDGQIEFAYTVSRRVHSYWSDIREDE